MGAVNVGVVGMYRTDPGGLRPDEQLLAKALAMAIGPAAVQRALAMAGDHAGSESADSPAFRREVHQATGMILVQLNTSATAAYAHFDPTPSPPDALCSWSPTMSSAARSTSPTCPDTPPSVLDDEREEPTMTADTREAKLSAAFVKLADTLIADFDMVDLLHWLVEECTDILDTQEGGLLLADPTGALQVIASTSEEAQLVEVLQLSAGAGPCLDCFVTGAPGDRRRYPGTCGALARVQRRSPRSGLPVGARHPFCDFADRPSAR